MKKEQFELVISQGSWTIDRWGHYSGQVDHYIATRILINKNTGQERVVRGVKAVGDGERYRLKVQATSVRLEKRVDICGKKEWMRICSDYYKNIVEVENGGKKYLKIDRVEIPIHF